MEETAAALDQLVRQGKTLYVGISDGGDKEWLTKKSSYNQPMKLTPKIGR